MGCKEKYTRTNRRPRFVKNEHDHNIPVVSESVGLSPLNYEPDLSPIKPNIDGGVVDESGWGYCTEEQLEEILLQNLEILYNEAINKLIGLGYDEDVAMKAILKNGHCYGGMDVLTNILHNSLSYLNSGSCLNLEESDHCFVDLRQLEEYSLAGMVCLLQQVKPHLSKGDAMWCLLMSDLHVGRASAIEVPTSNGSNGCVNGPVSNSSSSANVEGVGTGPVGVVPAMCRFHGGWGFGDGRPIEFPLNRSFLFTSGSNSEREIDCPKRFNLTPSMKTLLKRNVAAFAAGFRSNPKHMQNQSQACPSFSADGDQSHGAASGVPSGLAQAEDSQNSKSQDVVNSVAGKFRDLNLDENTEKGNVQMDQKESMVLSLIQQIKELERQAKERKEWAHQKAMQAARKLSHDLTELKMLRMEREDTQRVKKGKQTIEDTTMKRLSEMENALRKASGQVDRANLAVKKLENENAEIRAEMEASKLSASESAKTCMEAAKREKKCIKKLGAWEKQKKKLQEDIAAEKQMILDLQKHLVQVEAAQKEAEANWRQEQKAKEHALAQVEEEQRLKEAAEATNKRKLEALRLKIEIDFQRHKDDLQRLEQELSRLKASMQTTELQNQSARLVTGNSNGEQRRGDISRMLHELDGLEDSSEKDSCDRVCLICKKDEVSVVFLPCAHQVLCANCNDNYGKKGRAKCPCCRVTIEQRIRVFGASS